MSNYTIDKACLKAKVTGQLNLANSYDQIYNELIISANSDIAAVLNILGEIAGVVANLGFLLGKIPGGGSPTVPPLGTLIPIVPIMTNVLDPTVASVAATPSGTPVSLGNILNKLQEGLCTSPCLTGPGGELSSNFDDLFAQLFRLSSQDGSLNASVSASSAKLQAQLNIIFTAPPIIVEGAPPPAPVNMLPIYQNLIDILNLLNQLLTLNINISSGISRQISSIYNTMQKIKNIVKQIHDLMVLFTILATRVKKNFLFITKFIVKLEKILKAIVLSVFVFFLPTPFAAQMAAWFGMIGQAMASIESLLAKAGDHLVEAENKTGNASGAKGSFEMQLDGMQEIVDSWKSCLTKKPAISQPVST
jgi:hypothetical protein